jgi:phospholipid/cholesterol/gamma-HCH transport system substrate-binding protein
MDRDANYVAVGAFVILVIAMAGSFVFWYTDQRDKHTYQRYEIYFQGTVSGLTAGSPVRYLGVDVGKVARIRLDPEQRNRVLVLADIESNAPIDARTQASLSLQGITGLLYIDLEQSKASGTAAPLAQGREYPVIRSVPSDFDVLLSSLPALATHAIELVDHFDKLLSEANVRDIHETLENVKLVSARLPATLHELEDMIGDLRHASQEFRVLATDLHGIAAGAAPDIQASLSHVAHATDRLDSTADRLDQFLAANQPGISRFTQQSLPELEQLLRESRAAARDFRDLSRTLKQNPSQLLYESNHRGVEVPP